MKPLEDLTVVSLEQAVGGALGHAPARRPRRAGHQGGAAGGPPTAHGTSRTRLSTACRRTSVWLENRSKESLALDLKSESTAARSSARSLRGPTCSCRTSRPGGGWSRLRRAPCPAPRADPLLDLGSRTGGARNGGGCDLLRGGASPGWCPSPALRPRRSRWASGAGRTSLPACTAYGHILTALLHQGVAGQGATLEVSVSGAPPSGWGSPCRPYGGSEPARSGASHSANGTLRSLLPRRHSLGIQNEPSWAGFCAKVLDKPPARHQPHLSTNSLRAQRAAREPLRRPDHRTWLEETGIANARS